MANLDGTTTKKTQSRNNDRRHDESWEMRRRGTILPHMADFTRVNSHLHSPGTKDRQSPLSLIDQINNSDLENLIKGR